MLWHAYLAHMHRAMCAGVFLTLGLAAAFMSMANLATYRMQLMTVTKLMTVTNERFPHHQPGAPPIAKGILVSQLQ